MIDLDALRTRKRIDAEGREAEAQDVGAGLVPVQGPTAPDVGAGHTPHQLEDGVGVAERVGSYNVGGYGNLLAQIARRNFPNYAAGFSLNITIRNRAAQADTGLGSARRVTQVTSA